MKHVTMMFLIVAGILLSNVIGESEPLKGGASMPRKELLRPMILPKGGWQVHQRNLLYINKPSDSLKYGISGYLQIPAFISEARRGFKYYNSVFGLFPRFAVSDRVEFGAFPLPYVTVLMTGSDIGYQPDSSLNRFSMTFEGGLTGLSIAEVTNVTLNFAAGINTKLLLSDRWWHEQHFRASYVSRFQVLSLAEEIGVQCTDIFAVTMGLFGGMSWVADGIPHTDFIAGGEAHLIANLSRWVSIDVFGGGKAIRTIHFQKNEFSASTGATLIVQW